MAKKQTRRSISVSRTTYERLKAFCETNHISMSQLVETRVNDFLGPSDMVRPESGLGGPGTQVGHAGHAAMMSAPATAPSPRPVSAMSTSAGSAMPQPASAMAPRAPLTQSRPVEARPGLATAPAAAPAAANGTGAGPVAQPMTSAAARFAVDPPPPIIKPRQETAAPKPAEKRPDQIFTF